MERMRMSRIARVNRVGATPIAPAVPPASAGYWKFDGDLLDSSGNGRDLTGASDGYTTGKFGSALNTGSASRANDILNGDAYTGTYSISAWAYVMTQISTHTCTFLDDALNPVVQFRVAGGVVAAIVAEWAFGAALITTLATSESWHHCLISVSGSVGRLYVDGAFVDSVSLAGLGTGTFGTAANTFQIATTATDRCRFDDVACVRSALNEHHAMYLWNSGAGNLYQ